MPRSFPSNSRRRSTIALIFTATFLLITAVAPAGLFNLLGVAGSEASARETSAASAVKPSASAAQPLVSSGEISFSSQTFSVNEGAGTANITLARTNGSSGVLAGKVTLANVTTSSSDYVFSPGSVDTAFNYSAPISAGLALSYGYPTMALQADGKLLVTENTGIYRLNPDGSTDTAFGVGTTLNSGTNAAAIQPDGKIIIAGGFTTINNQRANHVARLNGDGSFDPSFDVGTGPSDGYIKIVIVQPDGKVLVLGDFKNFNGIQQTGLVRLNTNGSVDTSYVSPVGIFQYSMALQSDGKVLVGGSGGIQRLNTDGTPDNTFNPQFSGAYPFIDNIVVQPDGKVIIVGNFDHVSGQVTYGIARLNVNGSLDSTFNTGTGPDANPVGLALQPDGKVLIGGSFKSFNGTTANTVARLNVDGSLDTTFVSGTANQFSSAWVNNILLQPDGKMYIRGSFSAPGAKPYFARLRNDLFVAWQDGDSSNKTVTLPIVNDQLDEVDETLTLNIAPIDGAQLGTPSTATLTILDNDVTLSNVSGSGTFASTATLTATLTKNGSGLSGKTINFSLNGVALGQGTTDANGVATFSNVNITGFGAGTYTGAVSASFAGDSTYGAKSGTGPLVINKADQTITLGPLPDKTASDQDFNVTSTVTSGFLTVSYSASGQCTMGNFSSSVHITGVGTCTIKANQAGNNNYNPAPEVQKTFNITKATKTPNVTSSANPSDFGQSVTFTATIPSGGAVPTGTIQFKVDGVNAGGPIAVTPSGITSGSASFSTSTLSTGTHTVTADYSGDSNFNPTSGTLTNGQVVKTPPTISILDFSITEGSAGTKNAAFTVLLSASSNLTVKVDYATANGTAIAGSDYQATTGTLTFSSFQTIKTVNVVLTADTINEPDETFFLNLTNPENATISDAQAIATILNDDTPFVQLSNSVYTVSEDAANTSQGYGLLSVTVNRTGDRSEAATVQYFTSDQSGGNECNQVTAQASQRCDYGLAAGTLRFAAGEASKTISISIINDGYTEGTEFFNIKLQNVTGAILGATNQATITLLDNDQTASTPANNPYLSNELFVRMNYLDFLGREPDAEGWSTWTNALNTCGPEKGFLGAPPNCDRAFVSHGFIASPEFTERGYLAYRIYEVGAGRLPRYNEFVPDMAAMSGAPGSQELAQNTAQFAESFVTKQDFINRYADVLAQSQAAQLIDKLELNAGVSLTANTTTLPGQPTQYNRQDLIDKRASGQFTLGQTLRAFVEQKAVYDRFFERGFVTMQYFGYLRRDPDLNDPNLTGWTEWVYVFTNGGATRGRPDIGVRDYHHLVFGFIYSEEYRKRFGAP
ncbi:MAG TPA: Calx-beta domain-containing protein [Pyrinomonadaceae bacterium]|jgi:uncharacterized delta-60 repeat protein